ncbi:hypothetical protein [Streptomyces sp. NPDC000983]|uniref:hypothetical protein n=1 Tax=Streptomyces sp. NPDC000983 TaxID=3154373 RepID=UPI003318E49D
MTLRMMATVLLSDGRPQIWAVNDAGELVSSWKRHPADDPDTGWAGWTPFPGPSGVVQSVATVKLPDGRPQLIVATNEGEFTKIKANTHPDAAWTEWGGF